jgi:hypothetical protein
MVEIQVVSGSGFLQRKSIHCNAALFLRDIRVVNQVCSQVVILNLIVIYDSSFFEQRSQ